MERKFAFLGAFVLGFKASRPAELADSLLEQLGEYLGAGVRRKRLKQELQQVFESVPDIICIVGTDRRFKRVNRAMCELTGYKFGQVYQNASGPRRDQLIKRRLPRGSWRFLKAREARQVQISSCFFCNCLSRAW